MIISHKPQATFTVHFLTLFSVLNASYTLLRRRYYRLFEKSVDEVPGTPSAKRVRVDTSTDLSPPRDVWELAVWDPLPICLRLFCYFSPGHVLIYWLFLPTLASDSRPSITIVKTILLIVLVTVQLSLIQFCYSTQIKDSAYISKEVLSEYDKKYVRPRSQPLYRDVGTQFSEKASYSTSHEDQYNKVETYSPVFIINRGFKTNANPYYSQYTNRDGVTDTTNLRQPEATPDFRSPTKNSDLGGSALRPLGAIRQPNFRPTSSGGEGGSLGVYSHAASPLRKSASTNFQVRGQDGGLRDRSNFSPGKRSVSPDKRMSVPAAGINTLAASQRWGHLKPDRQRRESGRF